MSAAAARLPLTSPAAPPRLGRTARGAVRAGSLRLVPQRRTLPRRAPFVAVVVGLLAVGLLVLLVLNTVLAQDAFRLHALQAQAKVLADREQALSTAVEALEAPAALSGRATELGMVPGGAPAFLDLATGQVSGLGTPAQAPALVGDRAVPPAAATAPDPTGTGTGPGSSGDTPTSGSTR